MKSIVNMTGVVHIILGSYAILPLVDASSDILLRRTATIHFARYHHDVPEDVDAFRDVLATFQLMIEKKVRLKVYRDFESDWQYFYSRCIGCTGIVKPWLDSAVEKALAKGTKKLTKEIIESSRQENDEAIKALLLKAEAGERNLLPKTNTGDNALEKIVFGPGWQKPEEPSEEQKKKANSRPGKRGPHYDPVGPAAYGFDGLMGNAEGEEAGNG